MDWQIRLITIYVYVSEQYQNHLWPYCQRFSNNSNPEFTDEEVITVFLFGIMQRRFEIKDIYNYARNHLDGWFTMPSYVAFVQRLNRLESLFPALCEKIIEDFSGTELLQRIRLIDSFPVIMANGKRSSRARTVNEFANKGYCASKGIYYYGVKVHILAANRSGKLPIPDYIGLAPASDHDLTIFRQISPQLKGFDLYADMAYIDEFEQEYLQKQNVDMYIPIKKKKGQRSLDLFDKLFSTGVSSIRQPIESLFNWIQEKTKIEAGSKIRSYSGLCVHIFGRLAASMFMLAFNS